MDAESWRDSTISALDGCQSYLSSILSSAIDDYANVMLAFNKLGVENHVSLFPETAQQGVFGSKDWRSNLEMFDFILGLTQKIHEISEALPILRSLNPTNLARVPSQLLGALADTNNYQWGWVCRDLKYSGAGLILSAIRILLDGYERNQMENAFDAIISFNQQLASVYQTVMNSPVDLAAIKSALYDSIGNTCTNEIREFHDDSVGFVSNLALPEGIDPNYYLSILRDINSELAQVHEYCRNVVIVGNSKYSISDMNAYKINIANLCKFIRNSEDAAFAADLVGDSLFLYTLALSPTGIGGAACAIASLVTSAAGVLMKSLPLLLGKEQALYTTVFQSSLALFQLLSSLPMIASDVNALTTKTLQTVQIPRKGQIRSLTTRNEWDSANLRYNTFFDVSVFNSGQTDTSGFIVFHVRSLDRNMDLADMGCISISASTQSESAYVLASMVHFSFWGGNYESRLELWFGPVEVAWNTVSYHVGLGGSIQTSTILEGDISAGESRSTLYDSSTNTQSSLVVLDYGGSEMNLHVYDALGHHLGVNYLTGSIDEEIPGAQHSGSLTSFEWAILPLETTL